MREKIDCFLPEIGDEMKDTCQILSDDKTVQHIHIVKKSMTSTTSLLEILQMPNSYFYAFVLPKS